MNWTFRTLLGIASILSLVLVLFLTSQVTRLRGQVADLTEVLATKDDLVRVSTPQMKFFHEEKCTSCHTERRFAGEHSSKGQIEAALAHMKAMPDATFTEDDMAKIHSSLQLLRCASCHGEEQLRLLALKSPEQRMDVIRRMAAMPGSNISPDEAESIQRAYQQLFGF